MGLPVSDLQAQLGHASLTVTGIYLQRRPNHRRESFQRIGGDSILEEGPIPIIKEKNEIKKVEPEFKPKEHQDIEFMNLIKELDKGVNKTKEIAEKLKQFTQEFSSEGDVEHIFNYVQSSCAISLCAISEIQNLIKDVDSLTRMEISE